MTKFFQTANSPEKNIRLEVKPSLLREKCLHGFLKVKKLQCTALPVGYIHSHPLLPWIALPKNHLCSYLQLQRAT
jgi:hypothetical protein